MLLHKSNQQNQRNQSDPGQKKKMGTAKRTNEGKVVVSQELNQKSFDEIQFQKKEEEKAVEGIALIFAPTLFVPYLSQPNQNKKNDEVGPETQQLCGVTRGPDPV